MDKHTGIRSPRLQHVSLAIPKDMQDAVRTFYGGVLGLEEKPVPHTLQHLNLVWFAVGEDSMELHFVPDTILPNPEESRHFCLEVDNLDEYRQKVTEAGYKIIETEPIPNRPRFFCRDPFNNRLEFTTILGDYREGQ